MTSRMGWWGRSPLAVGMACLFLSGCGGGDSGELPTVRVSGTLLVDGKPVSAGTVHFQPDKGPPATGIVKDGKFTLTTYKEGDGAIPGKNRVSVEVVTEVPTKDGDTTSKSLIAPKFMNPDESGIQLEVPQAGYSNLQIDIKGNAVAVNEG
jgi:hypothetical protein